jgi:hypothetical protein
MTGGKSDNIESGGEPQSHVSLSAKVGTGRNPGEGLAIREH